MNGTKNIYIDILKFGVDKMQTGVSFIQVKEYLHILGWEINDEFEKYIRFWFAMNFYHQDFEVAKVEGQQMHGLIQKLHIYDDKKLIMSAKAYEMLQDYEKLQETRKSANTAKWIAIASIIITGVLALVQIIVSLFADKVN